MPLLVVQRGHVPRTTGAVGGPGEQAMARRVAAAIAALMPHAGWTLRIIDADEPGSRYRGDAFVSLHGDASSSPSARGASVGYRNTAGRNLASRWKAAYRKHGWPYSFRADNYTAALAGYYGHRIAVQQGNAAACIVEHGFMTNPTERAWIDSPAGTRAAALAVVEAVTGSLPTTSPPEEELSAQAEKQIAEIHRAVLQQDFVRGVKYVAANTFFNTEDTPRQTWLQRIVPSQWIRDRWGLPDEGWQARTFLGSAYGHARDAKERVIALTAEVRGLRAAVAELADSLPDSNLSADDIRQIISDEVVRVRVEVDELEAGDVD